MSADHGLTDAEVRDLRALVGVMIPASAEYKVPGADDEMIFADILRSIERDGEDCRRGLKELSALSGGSFATLSAQRTKTLAPIRNRNFLGSVSLDDQDGLFEETSSREGLIGSPAVRELIETIGLKWGARIFRLLPVCWYHCRPARSERDGSALLVRR